MLGTCWLIPSSFSKKRLLLELCKTKAVKADRVCAGINVTVFPRMPGNHPHSLVSQRKVLRGSFLSVL